MAFTTVNDLRTSDLLIQEKGGYRSRETVNVSLTAGATLKQGTVLFRAKGTDPTVAYDLVGAGNLSTSNEYAVLMGDGYAEQEEVVFATATPKKALVIVRDADFKEAPILAIHDSALSDSQWASLKHLLSQQDILVYDTVVGTLA